MSKNLYDRLIEYSRSDAYPFHMPGHKRNMMDMEDPYRFDLTEIDGFDNLHDAQDLLLREQERTSRIYGSDESHWMVNGSTGGLLAAIAGVCRRGDRVLAARNCHTSVYHAIERNGLRPVYLWPEVDKDFGIYKGLSREQVEYVLDEYPDIKAVVFTSPTYEGNLSDVRGICEAAHKRGIPCIVDEAHGAHLRFIGMEDALLCGADVVIQSLHKTMPALTQTALLHIQGNLVSSERIQRMLATYQTSSPSYVFMASISKCMTWLENEGTNAFGIYKQENQIFRERLSKLRYLTLYHSKTPFDWGKWVIHTRCSGMSGRELYNRLRDEFGLQMEMVSAEYVLAMTTVGDRSEGLERLTSALEQIDSEIQSRQTFSMEMQIAAPKRALEMDEAVDQPTEMVPLFMAKDRIIGDYIYLYPPGIPLLVPGEILDERQIKQIEYYESQGLDVHGGYLKESKDVKVILHHG